MYFGTEKCHKSQDMAGLNDTRAQIAHKHSSENRKNYEPASRA